MRTSNCATSLAQPSAAPSHDAKKKNRAFVLPVSTSIRTANVIEPTTGFNADSRRLNTVSTSAERSPLLRRNGLTLGGDFAAARDVVEDSTLVVGIAADVDAVGVDADLDAWHGDPSGQSHCRHAFGVRLARDVALAGAAHRERVLRFRNAFEVRRASDEDARRRSRVRSEERRG